MRPRWTGGCAQMHAGRAASSALASYADGEYRRRKRSRHLIIKSPWWFKTSLPSRRTYAMELRLHALPGFATSFSHLAKRRTPTHHAVLLHRAFRHTAWLESTYASYGLPLRSQSPHQREAFPRAVNRQAQEEEDEDSSTGQTTRITGYSARRHDATVPSTRTGHRRRRHSMRPYRRLPSVAGGRATIDVTAVTYRSFCLWSR